FSKSSTEHVITNQITLNSMTQKQAVESLNAQFDSKSGAPVANIAAEPNSNAIMVRGTPEQIKAVKDTLESLGEKPRLDQASNKTRRITLEMGSASTLAQALARMIPQIRKNPIQLIVPGSGMLRTIGGDISDG